MTKDEAKQTVADDHGFTNWHHMIEYLQMSGERTLLKIYIDEAMETYANENIYNMEQKLVACETILEEKTTIILSAINLMKALKLFRTLSPDAVIAISECIQIIEGLDKGQIHGTDRQT